MALYRFLGTTATLLYNGVPKTVLNQWGQSIELTETEARERVADHLSIIPDGEFQKLFSEEEAAKYRQRMMHEIQPGDLAEAKAHADFIRRRNMAWDFNRAWREAIAKGEPGPSPKAE